MSGLSINFNRGLKGMAEGLIRRVPNGARALDGGLRDVVHRIIDQHPGISKTEFTAVEVAERIGLLKPEKSKRKGRK